MKLLLTLTVGLLIAAAPITNITAGTPPGSESTIPLRFSSDLDQALEESRGDGRPLFVVFVAAWCPICTEMKKEALTDPSITAYADQFRWIMVDIDRSLSIARRHEIEAVPISLLFDSSGNERRRIVGGRTAEELHAELGAFLADEPAPEESAPAAPGAAGPRRSDLIWSPKGYRGASICFSHVGYGPLNLYSQSPFQALRLGIRPRTPSTLGKGQHEFRATATWVNIWANSEEGDYFLDFEMLQTVLAFAYGIRDTLQIEVEVQQRDRFGGAMDPFVQGFHDLFGIDQSGRDEVPRHQFTFDLDPQGGPSISLESSDRGTFTRSVEVSMQHNVTCGTAKAPAFSYSATTRYETADGGDLSGGGDVDFGASIALARRVKHFYFYGTLGYAWFGRDQFRGLELEKTQYTVLAAAEWRFRAKQSLLLQYLITEGQARDFEPFDDASHEITLGWKWEAWSRTVIEAGLIENLISFDNSPDFGIHLGFVRRF